MTDDAADSSHECKNLPKCKNDNVESLDTSNTQCSDIDTSCEQLKMLKPDGVSEGNNEDSNTDEGVTIIEEADEEKAPDGGWGWVIVLASFFVHVIMGGFERSNGVMYLQMESRYNRSATETAWVLSIFSTLRLVMGPLASMLSSRFSCRFVTIVGALLCSVGVFFSAFVPDLFYLYLTYGFVCGLGRSFTYTPALIVVGIYFNKRRGLAVGLATSGVGLGGFFFPPLVELMFDHYGFAGTFIILSAVIANFLVCGALYRPLELQRQILENDKIRQQRKDAREQSENLLESIPMSSKQQNGLESQLAAKMSSSSEISANAKLDTRKTTHWKREFKITKSTLKESTSSTKEKSKAPLLELALFRNFAFTALCIQIFLFTLSFNSTFVFLPALAKEKGVSKIEGAYLISILGIFDMVARIVMSTVLDLKPVKPYRLIIYNGVMFANAAVAISMPSMTQFWQFAVTSALYGTLSGTYISQKSVVVVDVLGVEKLSSSFGLLLLFQGLSALVGPTVGGLFKDFLGSYNMAFYFGSSGIIAGGIMMAAGNFWLYRQKRDKTDL